MVYISAERLHECSLQFEDELLEQASLFPFFDRAGKVDYLLLIDHARQAAYVFPFDSGLARPALFRKLITLQRPFAGLTRLSPDAAEPLGKLWHFDPWWLLDGPPFDVQPATPLLKTTNCANLLAVENPSLGYRRDLSRVTWLLDGEGDKRSGKRWQPAHLPERHPEATTKRVGRSRWVLDPIWGRS